MKIMVSACLLGRNCEYNGGNNKNEALLRFLEDHEVIPICPETEGGLKTPRKPAEIVGERVMTRDGDDVTREYKKGAETALERAISEKPDLCILQSRSPSCGVNKIYDGSFTGKLKAGSGITAELLKDKGFKVTDIEDFKG